MKHALLRHPFRENLGKHPTLTGICDIQVENAPFSQREEDYDYHEPTLEYFLPWHVLKQKSVNFSCYIIYFTLNHINLRQRNDETFERHSL